MIGDTVKNTEMSTELKVCIQSIDIILPWKEIELPRKEPRSGRASNRLGLGFSHKRSQGLLAC